MYAQAPAKSSVVLSVIIFVPVTISVSGLKGPRSPLKELGAALGPGFCSECRIFIAQQTTIV